MSSNDVYLVSLLVAAFLLIEARSSPSVEARPRDGGERGVRTPPDRAGGCPRSGLHRVLARQDGAIWCHDCDEAYFPAWEARPGPSALS